MERQNTHAAEAVALIAFLAAAEAAGAPGHAAEKADPQTAAEILTNCDVEREMVGRHIQSTVTEIMALAHDLAGKGDIATRSWTLSAESAVRCDQKNAGKMAQCISGETVGSLEQLPSNADYVNAKDCLSRLRNDIKVNNTLSGIHARLKAAQRGRDAAQIKELKKLQREIVRQQTRRGE